MAGYVIIIRDKTTDEAGYPVALERYTGHAMKSPAEKVTVLASRNTHFQVVEGENAENIAILRFPTFEDATAWYNSDAYQAAIPHRQSVARYRAFIVEAAE